MLTKKELKTIEPIKTKQLSLFEIVEPKDLSYSNFAEFFDSVPMFVDDCNKRYFSYSNVTPTKSTEFEINQKKFIVKLKPGRVTRIVDGIETDVLVYPSLQREQIVYNALRKLAVSGQGGFFENELGTTFTMSMLQRELSHFGRTYSLPELTETLHVLRSAEIEIRSLDNSMVLTPSYLSNMALTTRAEYEKGGKESRCLVLFDNLLSSAVKDLKFRQFNYSIAQSTKNAIATYMTMRMDRNFKQASHTEVYSLNMSTIFKAVYRPFDGLMKNNKRAMVKAVDILKGKCRITGAKFEPIKSHLDGRVIIDYKITFFPHKHMISDMIGFHSKKNELEQRNIIYNDSDYEEISVK